MTDAYGRTIKYLRVSVTDRCNLRCRYCTPIEGVPKAALVPLGDDELLRIARVFAGLGIEKIRITGGEPLTREGVVSLCSRLSAIDGVNEVCITTNGVLLAATARPLVEAGVTSVNISLDTLDHDKYKRITRLGQLSDVLNGIKAALSAGFRSLKLNAVLMRGVNDDEIERLAKLSVDNPLDVRFIELMTIKHDSGFAADTFVPAKKVLEVLPDAKFEGNEGVAELYRLPNAKGRVGLISPVSKPFCAECNKLRLTCDGRLMSCLYSGTDTLVAGLSPEDMRQAILKAVADKPFAHEYCGALGHDMNEIGG